MATYIVDTYAWLEYFGGNGRYREAIEENFLKTPVLVLAELSRTFERKKLPAAERQKHLKFVDSRSVLVPFKAEEAVNAGVLAEKERLPLADAIIYAYASRTEQLLTGDSHFEGKENVVFLK